MATIRWYGDRAKGVARAAATRAVGICGSDLQRKSSQEAPIDTGDLRANCSVSPVEQGAEAVSVTVGYDLPYAIVQHERLDFRHPKGGGPKYLENPFNANKAKYERYIRDEVLRALGEG